MQGTTNWHLNTVRIIYIRAGHTTSGIARLVELSWVALPESWMLADLGAMPADMAGRAGKIFWMQSRQMTPYHWPFITPLSGVCVCTLHDIVPVFPCVPNSFSNLRLTSRVICIQSHVKR